MADEKQTPTKATTKSSADTALVTHLKKVIPDTDVFKKAGLTVDSVPTATEWAEALTQVKQTDAEQLDPVRVQIAVQRVMVSVVQQLTTSPESNASEYQRRATALIPIITRRIVGA